MQRSLAERPSTDICDSSFLGLSDDAPRADCGGSEYPELRRNIEYYLRRRRAGVFDAGPTTRLCQERCFGSAELLKVALSDQALDVALTDIKLAVLGEVDGSAALSVTVRMCVHQCHASCVETHPYSVCISPASFSTRTSMKRSLGGSKLPVRSMSVHWPL